MPKTRVIALLASVKSEGAIAPEVELDAAELVRLPDPPAVLVVVVAGVAFGVVRRELGEGRPPDPVVVPFAVAFAALKIVIRLALAS